MIYFAFIPMVVATQVSDEEVRARSLWDTTFLNKRPPMKKPSSSTSRTNPGPRPTIQDDSALIGVTFWRMRQSRPEDEKGVRVFVHGDGGEQEWTPERTTADGLEWGQRVRFSIEVDREGFLYIVDRERFASGTLGDPTLLFPARNLRGGNNHVMPGTLVDVPAFADEPPYFVLKKVRSDHVGEALTILLTPEPLANLEIADEPAPISADLVTEWEKRWGMSFRMLQAHNLAGHSLTLAEKQAANQQNLLSQTDPPPQTLYRVALKAREPVLITIPVLIR
jgi:hypothetical protein